MTREGAARLILRMAKSVSKRQDEIDAFLKTHGFDMGMDFTEVRHSVLELLEYHDDDAISDVYLGFLSDEFSEDDVIAEIRRGKRYVE